MALPAAASVVSSGLGAYPTLYFNTVALDTLRSNLFLYPGCDQKPMPENVGVVQRIYDHTAFSSNTTGATEGTPGAGQVLSQNTRDLTLTQYVDYLSFSDKVIRTAFVDTVADGVSELTFRGALSVDTVISTTLDTASNSDSATRIELNDGTYMSASVSRKAAYGLRKVNVKPKANGLFFGVLPSVMAFDMVNDATAGGFIDLTKYAANTNDLNINGVGQNGGARIGVIGGVEWFESNALPTETNWQSSANNAYHAYVLGTNGIVASGLGKDQLGQKNFKVTVTRFKEAISADPALQIPVVAAYNFFFGAVKRPGSTNGFRRIRGESSIG
jgi:N4-gp56 family major capsid protein